MRLLAAISVYRGHWISLPLLAATALVLLPMQTVLAQDCPTAATATRLASASVDELISRGAAASAEDRGTLVVKARAHTILAWDLLGLEGLRQNKAGLNLLAPCMGNGGCGFAKTPTGPIYGFITSDEVPAVLRAPPPRAAVQWAKEKLGCLVTQRPAQPQPQVVAASSTPRRPAPTLVPEGPAPADMQKTQQAIRVIDERCHTASTQAVRLDNCLMLAQSFNRGIKGFAYDPDSSNYYYKRACDDDSAAGCLAYGSHFRQWGTTEAEKQMGIEYVGKACDLGSQAACTNYKAWTGKARR